MKTQLSVPVAKTPKAQVKKKLLVLPAALDRNHPLFVGFTPRDHA